MFPLKKRQGSRRIVPLEAVFFHSFLLRLLFAFFVSTCGWPTVVKAADPESPQGEVGASATPAPASPEAADSAAQESASSLPAPRVFGEPQMDTPVSPIFRNTNITPLSARVDPTVTPGIHADPFELHSDFGFRGTGLKVPFVQRGFEPQNASLKLGPVYIKFRRVEGGMIASDNINLSETDRKPGVIAILRLDMGIILQLGEGFRLAVAGAFVYLPLQGKFGPNGYGLVSGLGLGTEPVITSQMTYDTMIGGWDVQFFDELSAGVVQFSNSIDANLAIFDGASFPWDDRAGIYRFGPPYPTRSQQFSENYRYNTNMNQQYLSNTVGFQTTRILPSDIRLSVKALQQNLWYNRDGRGMPSSRESATISAASVRENLRFKPFVEYLVQRVEPTGSVHQSVIGGVTGPITEQLYFYGAAGYAFNLNSHDNMLWRLGLTHIAGPNTTERLFFGRSLSTFDQEIYTHATYSLSQVLGPSITGRFIAIAEKVEDLTGGRNSYNNLWGGLRFTYFISPRTEVQAVGAYQYQYYTSYNQYLNVWTGQIILNYHFSDIWMGRLLYQYQERNTDLPNNSYYENKVMLTFSRFFL